MSSEKEAIDKILTLNPDSDRITPDIALSIAKCFKENIEEGRHGNQSCLRLNLNALNLIKEIKSKLFKGIGNIVDIPDTISEDTYHYHLLRLLDDALISISTIGHRKIKPKIKKEEDSHIYNTLKTMEYCYDGLVNTDRNFLKDNPEEFYIAFKKILHWITVIVKNEELSKSGCGKLNSLLIFKRGINRHRDHNQLFYVFNYKNELHDFFIKYDVDNNVFNNIKNDYLIILHGATCSFNLKHMNHCLQIFKEAISENSLDFK